MNSHKILTYSVFSFLPLLFILRLYYYSQLHKDFGNIKFPILKVATGMVETNKRIMILARIVIGTSLVGYSIIVCGVLLLRMS